MKILLTGRRRAEGQNLDVSEYIWFFSFDLVAMYVFTLFIKQNSKSNGKRKFLIEEEGTLPNLSFETSINYPNTKTRQRNHKRTTQHCLLRIQLQKSSEYNKYWTWSPSGIYPKNAGLVEHPKINSFNHQINRLKNKKHETHDHLIDVEKPFNEIHHLFSLRKQQTRTRKPCPQPDKGQ